MQEEYYCNPSGEYGTSTGTALDGFTVRLHLAASLGGFTWRLCRILLIVVGHEVDNTVLQFAAALGSSVGFYTFVVVGLKVDIVLDRTVRLTSELFK